MARCSSPCLPCWASGCSTPELLAYQLEVGGQARRRRAMPGFLPSARCGSAWCSPASPPAWPAWAKWPARWASNLNISPGYGFAAIIVAYLGRLHALGIVLAGALMALIYLGGEAAQVALQLPAAITGIFQGMLLFFLLGADAFIDNRLRRRK